MMDRRKALAQGEKPEKLRRRKDICVLRLLAPASETRNPKTWSCSGNWGVRVLTM